MGVKGNKEAKQKLVELGGHYNEHMRGYRFNSRDLDKVRDALQLEGNIDLIDPRRVIQVEFTQKFQWDGDLAMAEQKLKGTGLVKKVGAKGNCWAGDLSKASEFLRVFQFVSDDNKVAQ